MARQICSLYFFAMLFGSISPKKNINSVISKVEIVTADIPQIRVTATVTTDAAVR